MKRLLVFGVLAGLFLGPAAARAQDAPLLEPEPGSAPAVPPPATTVTAAPEAAVVPANGADEDDVDISARIPTRVEARRWWHLLGVYELHLNLISDEYGANDVYNWYMAQAKFDLSKHDQLGLRAELLQRFVTDPGEAALFPGDVRFYYFRKFGLPIPGFAVPGVASVYLTAPTSRESHTRSYLTRPTAQLSLAPSYGPVTLIATGIYRYTFARYAESSQQASANERQMAGVQAQLLYQPVDWFAPSFFWLSYWTEQYPVDGHGQGWRGNYYYFELAATFTLPMPEGAPGLDLSLAYAQGAPMLTGGRYLLAFAHRDQSELYLGLNVTY